MKILVIDDSADIHEMLKIFFENHDHQIISAYTAEEGIRQIVISDPDAIFLDIRLTDKDGIEVLKEIKQINKKVPVVMITGYKEAEKVIDAFRYGAIDCLLKPLNFDYLKNLLPQLKKM